MHTCLCACMCVQEEKRYERLHWKRVCYYSCPPGSPVSNKCFWNLLFRKEILYIWDVPFCFVSDPSSCPLFCIWNRRGDSSSEIMCRWLTSHVTGSPLSLWGWYVQVCFCSWHLYILDMNLRIFGVYMTIHESIYWFMLLWKRGGGGGWGGGGGRGMALFVGNKDQGTDKIAEAGLVIHYAGMFIIDSFSKWEGFFDPSRVYFEACINESHSPFGLISQIIVRCWAAISKWTLLFVIFMHVPFVPTSAAV